VVAAARSRVRDLLDRARRDTASDVAIAGLTHRVYARIMDDLGAMQNGWRMTDLAIPAPAGRRGEAVVRARRTIQRLLHPLPQRQSEYNVAVNRIVSHLLEVVHEQALAIEQLDERIEALELEREARG
jgi:hypothetical protein